MAAVNSKECDGEMAKKGNENKTKITKSLLRVALFRSRKWNESCCLPCTLGTLEDIVPVCVLFADVILITLLHKTVLTFLPSYCKSRSSLFNISMFVFTLSYTIRQILCLWRMQFWNSFAMKCDSKSPTYRLDQYNNNNR